MAEQGEIILDLDCEGEKEPFIATARLFSK
jgi:hypothetical protein